MAAALDPALMPYRITREANPYWIVWHEGWGKRWPRRTGLIRREGDTFSHHESARTDESFIITEGFYNDPFPTSAGAGAARQTSPVGDSEPEAMDVDVVPPVDVGEPMPYDGRTHEWDYSCVVGTKPLQGLINHVPSAVIERDEYRYLLYALHKLGAEITPAASDATKPQEYDAIIRGHDYPQKSFLLVGQPGTGKTIFLIWLLLHLLEHRQPVAFQTKPDVYHVFRPDGVFRCPASGDGSDALIGVWALVDSNSTVRTPADALVDHAKVLVYACSPRKERWKDWNKYNSPRRIITEVPHVLEAAAAGKECTWAGGLDKSVYLYRRFGPSLGTIQRIQAAAEDRQQEEIDRQDGIADASAQALLEDPKRAANFRELDVPESIGSHLAFIRPERGLYDWRSHDLDDLGSCWVEVPTPHLRTILYDVEQALQAASLLDFAILFSGHAVTRSSAGWTHEQRMHRAFGRAGTTIDLIGIDGQIESTGNVLPVMVAALKRLSPDTPRYWIPPTLNFPGLDAVLTNGDRLFVLHATVSGEQSCPEKGLNGVRNALGPALTDRFHWHFVVVARSADLANASLAHSRTQLADFTLGQARRPVTVAAAVLPGFV